MSMEIIYKCDNKLLSYDKNRRKIVSEKGLVQ